MAEIANIIKKIATEGQKISTYPAKVVRVNTEPNMPLNDQGEQDAYSVDIMRADGAEIPHVRLKASVQDKERGIVCVPKVGSWVLVSIIETTETRAFISQYSEIDQIFLRIEKDDTYFELRTDGDATKLSYKRQESAGDATTNTPATYKDIAKLNFGADKVLKAKFWDATGDNVTQETIIAHDQVKIDFDQGEGYQAVIDSEKVLLEKDNLKFQLDEKFVIQAGGENLKTQLDMLITEISKIVVVQGTSPNVGALNVIKGKIGSILKVPN